MLYIFLVDFGGISGWGHYSRCLALSERLSDLGYKCVFSAITDDQLPNDFIRFDKLDQFISTVAYPVSLIVDTYLHDIEFDRFKVSAEPTKSLKISDTGECLSGYDAVLAAKSVPKDSVFSLGTTIFAGIDYFLLRREFSLPLKQRKKSLRKVTVFFGGGDSDTYNKRFFFEIQQSQVIKEFDLEIIVISDSIDPSFNNVIIGRTLVKSVRPSKEYAEILSETWLGIGGMGVSFWERVALNVPTLGVIMAANQAQNGKVLAEADLGKLCSYADLINTFENILILKDSTEDPTIKWSKNCEPFRVGSLVGAVVDLLVPSKDLNVDRPV